MNDLVQCQKMKSKFTVRNANKTFQTKNNQAVVIKHTSILNVIRFAVERPRKNCSKQKLQKPHININSTKLLGA